MQKRNKVPCKKKIDNCGGGGGGGGGGGWGGGGKKETMV